MSLPSESVTAVPHGPLRNVPDSAAEEPTQDLTKITWPERAQKPLTEVSDYKEGLQKTENFDAKARTKIGHMNAEGKVIQPQKPRTSPRYTC